MISARAYARTLAVVLSLLAFSALWSPQAAASEPSEELTLQQVLDSVEAHFPLLQAAELERAVAEADLLSAEGAFDVSWKSKATVLPLGYYESARLESVVEVPTALWGASAFGGFRFGRGDFPVYDQKLQTLAYGELRAGVNLPLWRNGSTDRRRTSLGRAELTRELAGLSVQGQRVELRRNATVRYWAWVAAGRRVTIARELLRIAEDRDAGLGERVAHGDLATYERTDNARAIEQRKAQVASAQRGLEQASIALSLLLRDAAGQMLQPDAARLPTGLPEPNQPGTGIEKDLAAASAQRVEPRRFQLLERAQGLEYKFAKNQLAPAIDLQIAGAQDIGRADPARPDLSKPQLELSLVLEVPLQTRVMQGRAQAASAEAERARIQHGYARDRLNADVSDAHSALRAATGRIEATRKEVALAVELEEGERTRFDHGESHLLTVNIREQQTAEARLREVDALLDYQQALADLAAARGET